MGLALSGSPALLIADEHGSGEKDAKQACGPNAPLKQAVNLSPGTLDSITVGANSDIGSGAKLLEKAGGLVGGLVGGMFGGGGGGDDGGSLFGSGLPGFGNTLGMVDSDSDDEDPELAEDPVSDDKKILFTDPATGTKIKVGMVPTEDGMQVSATIVEAPGDGTFQAIYVQDSKGRKAGPTGYTIYELYLDWELTVTWTYDRYVDGENVEHKEGGWSEGGRTVLDTFAVPKEGEGIWKTLGFSTAAQGIQSMGVSFPVTKKFLKKTPMDLIIHITQPDKDPVKTTVFALSLFKEDCDKPEKGGTKGGDGGPRIVLNKQSNTNKPRPSSVCGPDITDQVLGVLRETKRRWDENWNEERRRNLCESLLSWTDGRAFGAWDMHYLSPMDATPEDHPTWPGFFERYTTQCAKPRPRCSRTAEFLGQCIDSQVINYVFWGAANRLCDQRWEAIDMHRNRDKLVAASSLQSETDKYREQRLISDLGDLYMRYIIAPDASDELAKRVVRDRLQRDVGLWDHNGAWSERSEYACALTCTMTPGEQARFDSMEWGALWQ